MKWIALITAGSLPSSPMAMDAMIGGAAGQEESYVFERCQDFAEAVKVYGIVLKGVTHFQLDASSPVEDELAWVNSETVRKALKTPTAGDLGDHPSFVEAYLDAFGPVGVRTLLVHTTLYQSDKATCLENFGEADGG